MKLIVGLGNPGKEYVNTRHNIGFMYLDYLYGNVFQENKKFKALEYITTINDEKVIIIKPLTYMNLSGEAVIKYVNYYKIKPEDILVIQDDLDMEVGRSKLLFKHGDGGHNGIKNIILNIGSNEFLRLKIGIGKNSSIDTKDYVLGKFSTNEIKILENKFANLNNFINDYIIMNRDVLIGKYNTKIDKQKGYK